MTRGELERSEFRTTDPQEAFAFVSTAFNFFRPNSAPAATCHAELSQVQVGQVTMARSQWRWVRCQARVEPPPTAMLSTIRSGWKRLTVAGRELAIGPGQCTLHPRHEAVLADWDHLDQDLITVPYDVLARVAAEHTGVLPERLRFTAMRPVSPVGEHLWTTTHHHVRDMAANPRSLLAEPLVRAATLDMLATTVLAAFPNTAMILDHRPGPGQIRPAALRRAVQYMEEHAALPITLTDAAEAAGTSPHALRHAFRHHLGVTPAAYLRRVRLAGAHRDLGEADPLDDSAGPDGGWEHVARVAARWGFSQAGYFAVMYRKTYGQGPRDTTG